MGDKEYCKDCGILLKKKLFGKPILIEFEDGKYCMDCYKTRREVKNGIQK